MRPLAVSTAVLHLLTYAQLLSGTRRMYCYDATAPQRGFMSRPTGGVEAACKERYCCNQYCCIGPPSRAIRHAPSLVLSPSAHLSTVVCDVLFDSRALPSPSNLSAIFPFSICSFVDMSVFATQYHNS